MKRQKIEKVKDLAASSRRVSNLTAAEKDFYDEKGFMKLAGKHKAVLLNPTARDMQMVRELAQKIPVQAIYLQEPIETDN